MRDNAKNLESNFERHLDSEMRQIAAEGEQYMKENAPWNDNTGNRADRVPGDARRGLNATTRLQGRDKMIQFRHGVDYGIWLEVNYNGRYQIIMPTVKRQGRLLMRRLRNSLNTLGQGRP